LAAWTTARVNQHRLSAQFSYPAVLDSVLKVLQ
jgi:hypothetical protein